MNDFEYTQIFQLLRALLDQSYFDRCPMLFPNMPLFT